MYNQRYLTTELPLKKEKVEMPLGVSEVAVQSRVATGFEDLDRLLLGGIPETYPVVLTSPFCDERDFLIERFLEEGTKDDATAFYVSTEVGGIERLAEEFQSNFHYLICNPRADIMIKDLPNVVRLRDVMNLTNINIALNNAFRRLDEKPSGQRRICIGIVSDVLLQHQAITTKRWLSELVTELRARRFTTLAVVNPLMHPPQDVEAILGLFEGEIAVYDKKTRGGAEKFLKVRRMYNQRYLATELPLKKGKV
jgi:KaiC/GvpD/RAD55 family RecA-like ATPase